MKVGRTADSQEIDRAVNLDEDDEFNVKKVQRERLESGRYAVDRIPEAAAEASRGTALQRASSVTEGVHRSMRTAETREFRRTRLTREWHSRQDSHLQPGGSKPPALVL